MGSDSESTSTLASESSVSEQTSRARQALLRKRLHDKDRLISDKDAELVQLRGQLDAKDRVVQELSENVSELQLRLTELESSTSERDVPQAVELPAANQTQVIVSFNTFSFHLSSLHYKSYSRLGREPVGIIAAAAGF